jgi:hypothetical protein
MSALMFANVIISEVDALIYVIVSDVEKCVPCGELVGTRECLTLYPRCCANRGSYNSSTVVMIDWRVFFDIKTYP